MKFAFIIMGPLFNMEKDRAIINKGLAQIIGVSNLEEACMVAKQLYIDGIDCIELCGAFGEEGTKRIIKCTENKIPIGYVTHLAEQSEIFQSVFGK